MKDKTKIREGVLSIINGITDNKKFSKTPSSINELNELDSLSIIRLLVAIEDQFSITITLDEIVDNLTIENIMFLILKENKS